MTDKIHPSEYGELDKFISRISEEIHDDEQLVVKRFEDFVDYLPEIGIGQIGRISAKNIAAISLFLDRYNLNSEPRVHMGYVPRRYESTIVMFANSEVIDYSTNRFKFATLVVRVMVLMAQADGVVVNKEKREIAILIDELGFLRQEEKNVLKARAICLINDTPSYRLDFYEYSIKKIMELDSKSQDSIIELIKDIAICDGYIDEAETKLIRDIYKSLELPTDNVKRELSTFAKNKKIKLRDYKDADIDKIINEDVDLDEMEFDVDQILADLNE